MKIKNIRQLVDDVLSKKINQNKLLELDLESKHYDIPLLGLISGKIHFPESHTDKDFFTLLSIYRKIEIEKEQNKRIFKLFLEERVA
jgi:hypothetical protein